MPTLSEIKNLLLANEGLGAWLLSIAVAGFLAPLIKFALNRVVIRLQTVTHYTKSQWDDLVLLSLSRTKGYVIFFWLLYLAIKIFVDDASVLSTAGTVVLVITLIQGMIWGFSALHYWKANFLLKRAAEDASAASAVGLVYAAIQGTFIIVLILIGLSNLGIDIAALLAGLGVGGIAVALAAQNVLGDLLASLSIVLDKPFVVGDFINVGGDLGSVENIGLKTTRVRSLTGEQLIFSNKDLLESRIRNYKRMWERRVVHTFGVTYSTPVEKLAKIPEWVKGFVNESDKLRFDRCHFAKYGDSSLDFELVFWVTDPDYNVFMDHQQKLLLSILNKFNEEGIDFAFPTQTLFVEKVAGLELPSPMAAADIPRPRISGPTAMR